MERERERKRGRDSLLMCSIMVCAIGDIFLSINYIFFAPTSSASVKDPGMLLFISSFRIIMCQGIL